MIDPGSNAALPVVLVRPAKPQPPLLFADKGYEHIFRITGKPESRNSGFTLLPLRRESGAGVVLNAYVN